MVYVTHLQIDERHDIGAVKSKVCSQQCLTEESLSEEILTASLVLDGENCHQTRDLSLKLEVGKGIDDSSNDDKDDKVLQSENKDELRNDTVPNDDAAPTDHGMVIQI